MKHFALTVFLLLLITSLSFAQKPSPTPTVDENDVVKISTNLVQLDAIVIDKKGNPVNDLTADDFEILQDGKSQKITNFSYISRIIDSADTEQTIKKINNKSQIPPVSFPPKEFGRVITFVVDDGNECLEMLSIQAIKEGLEKFVKEQMLPNDTVAIYRTRKGSSLLQLYTSDKSRLLQIIKSIRWYPPERGFCQRITSQVNIDEKPQNTSQREGIENSVNRNSFSGALGVGAYAINGLRGVGGRKILFIMSDSISLMSGERQNAQLSDNYAIAKDLIELANRNSVVIHTIDARGLTNPAMAGVGADTDVEGIARTGGESVTSNILARQSREENLRQGGLSFLANGTGGQFFHDMNFLDVPIEKALKVEKGYYLLAYEPDDDFFKGKKFHNISVKLKRDDLKISSRAGFYGVTDEEIRPKPRNEDSELYYALTTPLPNADLNIRLSAYFANNPQKGNFIRALLYIDGKDINFLDEPGKTKKIVFDIVAVTLSEKNEVIEDTNRTATVHIPIDRIEDVRRDGLIYSVDVPVKKEGIYTFRTALRDKTVNRLGSSSQVIEIPNLSKSKLLISGLLISGVDANGNILPTESGDSAFSSVVSPAIAAIRKFKQNSVVAYTYTLYNAKPDKATNLPNLTIQTNLYYEGKLISEGQPQTAEISKQADLSRIKDFGYLKLNNEVAPGDYVLQVIIKDLTTNQTTSQWIDFEVVE